MDHLTVPAAETSKPSSQSSSDLSYSAYISKSKTSQLPLKKIDPASCLKDLSFVVTGEFDGLSRAKVEALIRDHGGKLVSSVSGRTDYLIVGRVLEDGRQISEGKKYQDGMRMGLKILREIQFQELLREKRGEPDFSIGAKT
jgi:NAD-dependent DNA ligase